MFNEIQQCGNGISIPFYPRLTTVLMPIGEQSDWALAEIIRIDVVNRLGTVNRTTIGGVEVPADVRAAAVAEWRWRYPSPTGSRKEWARMIDDMLI